jgi:hypothetical protein
MTPKAYPNIPTPSPNEVKKYLKRWKKEADERESALVKLFGELCPGNVSISDILIKVATLNDFYSTNILSTLAVAKHICSLKDVDARLSKGDLSLVDDIAFNRIRSKKKHFYSFATKYCSFHSPNHYVMYDDYVKKILMHFRDRDEFHKNRFSRFVADDLKDYEKFSEILRVFIDFYRLSDYSLKEVDIYLWQVGKKFFGKERLPEEDSQETQQQAIVEACRKLLVVGEVYETGCIKIVVRKETGISKDSIIPTDFCYNKENKGTENREHPRLFEWVSQGKLRYLGEGYSYADLKQD